MRKIAKKDMYDFIYRGIKNALNYRVSCPRPLYIGLRIWFSDFVGNLHYLEITKRHPQLRGAPKKNYRFRIYYIMDACQKWAKRYHAPFDVKLQCVIAENKKY